MTQHETQSPAGWEPAPKGYNRDLSLLVRGIFEHREKILEWHPWLPLTGDDPTATTPVAALILAWERWDIMQGACPKCGGRALGVSFGGLLSIGAVGGVCTGCSLMVSRPIRGFPAAFRGAKLSLSGTPYTFAFVNWRWGFRGIPAALVSLLGDLGETELPTSSSGIYTAGGGASYPLAQGVIECHGAADADERFKTLRLRPNDRA